ncbi:hypothetical protein SEA_FRANCOB_2 [Streptomyces phage Francob]
MNQNNSEEALNAFDPANFNVVMLIQMMRTYDVLLALLSIQDPIKAAQLSEMHEQGLTFTPAPAFSVEDEE